MGAECQECGADLADGKCPECPLRDRIAELEQAGDELAAMTNRMLSPSDNTCVDNVNAALEGWMVLRHGCRHVNPTLIPDGPKWCSECGALCIDGFWHMPESRKGRKA